MRIVVFSVLCFIVAEVSCLKKALLFNLETRSLADPYRENGHQKCPPYLTACPSATSRERQFNQNMTIGKRSLFSRVIYAKDEYAKNIEIDICENRIKPTMLYDTEGGDYEIGYELYFEDDKVNMTDKTYHRYQPVNITNPKFYEILNVSLPTSDGFVTKYEDNGDMKFNFTNENRTLIFYWIEVLSIKKTKRKIRVDAIPTTTSVEDDFTTTSFDRLRDKCCNYRSDDDDLYSEENQKKSLSSISAPLSLNKNNHDIECGQPFGCLEKSQIIPLWYFDSRSARLASCSHMNLIPVWKSIVEQLRRVDLYIHAVDKHLSVDNLIHGISGTLKMKVPIATLAGISQKHRKMYLSDPKNRKEVPIPEIIYRIVQVSTYSDDYDRSTFTAAIIIHNDPSADPNDKICDTLSGWDTIENNNATTGLTYVCAVTDELNNRLDAFDNVTLSVTEHLNLDYLPYYQSLTFPCEFSNETGDINDHFESLLSKI